MGVPHCAIRIRIAIHFPRSLQRGLSAAKTNGGWGDIARLLGAETRFNELLACETVIWTLKDWRIYTSSGLARRRWMARLGLARTQLAADGQTFFLFGGWDN